MKQFIDPSRLRTFPPSPRNWVVRRVSAAQLAPGEIESEPAEADLALDDRNVLPPRSSTATRALGSPSAKVAGNSARLRKLLKPIRRATLPDTAGNLANVGLRFPCPHPHRGAKS
jgi:hypothetical protein